MKSDTQFGLEQKKVKKAKYISILIIFIALLSLLVVNNNFSESESIQEKTNTIYFEKEKSSLLSGNTQVQTITQSRRTAVVDAVAKAGPAVVSISVTQIVKTRSARSFYNDPFFDMFFPRYRRDYYQRVNVPFIGSGFIISEDGYILTNDHVVENAEEVSVTLPNKKKYKAKFIGRDKSLDIAILKVDGKNFPFIPFGDSDNLYIGEWAIALGNPFGLVLDDPQPSVTVGVVSALHRNFKPDKSRVYKNMIQTDASINPGNSGGPLLNGDGECIGMNTFILSNSGGSLGLGFAIPINKIKEVIDEVVKYGRVREAWTGLTVQNIDRLIAQSLSLESINGVIVSYISKKSPAAESGFKAGDVIISVDSKSIKNTRDIRKEFIGARVGDTFNLKIIRNGKFKNLRLKLKESPNN